MHLGKDLKEFIGLLYSERVKIAAVKTNAFECG
jgi:hypothetical protein